MNTKSPDEFGAALDKQPVGRVAILGVETAIKFARSGRVISAIKHIEAANPEISREKAKGIVYAFGYNCESRWPELERWPERNRLPVRCL